MGTHRLRGFPEDQDVLPIRRYKAHLVPEDGSLACLEAGIYVLRFDNTYSLVHSKHINSTVEVLLTDQTFVEKTEILDPLSPSLCLSPTGILPKINKYF
uniref:Uncharacterized protein n=1 Tax=Felis catus TaxID=9685 RepID=A0ABI7XUM9_FELCA